MSLDRILSIVRLRLRSLLFRGRVEHELREELEFHVEQRVAQELAHGASPDEARRIARRAFGGMDVHMEASRDTRRVSAIDHLVQDVRYGTRLLRRDAAFTWIVVLTLAVGIGATTAVFSVVDGVLLRPVPLADVSRLALVWGTDRNSGTVREPVSVPDFLDFDAASSRIGELAAFRGADVNLVLDGADPVRAAALAVTHNFLDIAGIRPLLGRGIVAGEDRPGGAQTVLIGEGLWDRAFGRDPGVIGRSVLLNDQRHTIEGVVPRGSDFGVLQVLSAAAYGRGFADRGDRTDVDIWMPYIVDPESSPRYSHPIFQLMRLAPGVSAHDAQAALEPVAAEMEALYTVNDGRGVNVEPLADVVFAPVRRALLVLLGAVGFVLLVACANVANLLLARGAARTREVAVRSALGAGGRRLAKQFLVENLLLALAGAALGVLLAFAGLELLLALAPANTPRIDTVGIDLRVLAFTLGVTVLVGIGFGMIPTLQSRRADVQTLLRREALSVAGGRERRRVRSALVIAEVALAVVLLVGAGLLLRSFWNLQGTDPGFATRGVLKAEFQLPTARYPIDGWPAAMAVHRFNDALLERVTALPGVQSAALTRNHPLDAGYRNSFTIIGREEESQAMPEISVRSVSPDYFAALGIRVLAGRGVTRADGTYDETVMVLNDAAARSLFPAGDAIGQRIALWGSQRRIVGVVTNERIHGPAAEAPPAVYMPLAQSPPRDGNESLLVRVDGNAAGIAAAVRAAFRELDPGLAVFGVEPLTQTLARSIVQRRFIATLLITFAAVAVLLALVGVHGLMSYTVAQRRHEIGIRMALGADRRRILASVLAEGISLALAGLVAGLLLAFALTRVIASLLHGVSAGDPLTIATAALGLTLSAVLTCWLPARRASRTDPAGTLREG